jgi:hypothetical protein
MIAVLLYHLGKQFNMIAVPFYHLGKKFNTGSTSSKALSPVDAVSKT